MPMQGTCQLFELPTGMLVYADGGAKRHKATKPHEMQDFVVVRYVHRTLPPRMRIMTLAFNDFLFFQEHGRHISETLSYLNSSEKEFLLSGRTDEELLGDEQA